MTIATSSALSHAAILIYQGLIHTGHEAPEALALTLEIDPANYVLGDGEPDYYRIVLLANKMAAIDVDVSPPTRKARSLLAVTMAEEALSDQWGNYPGGARPSAQYLHTDPDELREQLIAGAHVTARLLDAAYPTQALEALSKLRDHLEQRPALTNQQVADWLLEGIEPPHTDNGHQADSTDQDGDK